mgnify:CR=1 FL=1
MYQQNVVQQNVVHETLLLQQNVLSEGCSWQDAREAVESIKEVAERRHQEALQVIPHLADENHRRQVAQLADEAARTFYEQAQDHAQATNELRREAVELKTEASNYVSNRQAAEAQAQADNDEMRRIYASKDEESERLLMALQNAQATIAQNDADHLTQLSQAYATANQYAMVQAQAHAASVQAQNPAAGSQRGIDPRLSPSHNANNDDNTLRYDLSPRQSNVPTVDLNIRPSAASASSSNSLAQAGGGSGIASIRAKAGCSAPPTVVQTTAAGSVSAGSTWSRTPFVSAAPLYGAAFSQTIMEQPRAAPAQQQQQRQNGQGQPPNDGQGQTPNYQNPWAPRGNQQGPGGGGGKGPSDPSGGNGPSGTPPLLHRIRTCSNKDLLVLRRSLLAMGAMVKVATKTTKTNATKTPEGGTVSASRKPTK